MIISRRGTGGAVKFGQSATRWRVASQSARRIAASCVLAVLVLSAQGSPAQATAGWRGDGRSWTGSGSVLVPGAGHVGSSAGAENGCSGCRWHVAPVCADWHSNLCDVVALKTCGPRAGWFATYFAPSPRDELELVAVPCIGPDQRPIGQEELDRQVVQTIHANAPPLKLRYQPTRSPVTQLPTIFSTGQPRTFRQTDSILGFELRLVAQARWHWDWGDGSTSDTREPGGTWPNVSLSHTYRRAGLMNATVTASWDATYSIDGGAQLKVAGRPVSQTARASLRVVQARAVLTG